MADGQSDNDSNLNLPQPIIDKSTFPGAGMPLNVPSAPKQTDSNDQDAPTIPDTKADDVTENKVKPVIDDEKPPKPQTMLRNVLVPEYADDNDLIEKEWVNKAKHIIDTTRSDPHIQSNELTLFKADYIKKRYNKTIKTGE